MTATAARAAATTAAIREAVAALGHTWDSDRGSVVDGVWVWFDVSEQHTRGSGRFADMFAKPNGKLRVSFGDSGDRKSFPEPKAGFDIPRIAAALSEHIKNTVERKARQAAADTARRNAAGIAATINADHGLKDWSGIRATVNKAGNLTVHLELALTEDQARAIIAAALAATGMSS